jgi:hypothetical protein
MAVFNGPVAMATAGVAPYSDGCVLGSGYTPGVGCLGATPIKNRDVPCDAAGFPKLAEGDTMPCIEEGEDGKCLKYSSACVEYVHGPIEHEYSETVKSASDQASVMAAVANANGSGFGVTMSASAKYQEKNAYSENSVNFILGATIEHGRYQFKNYQELGIYASDDFRDMLRNRPEEFKAKYGEYFVAQVIKGGMFATSIRIRNAKTATSSDMKAFWSIQTPFGGGSGGFANAARVKTSNVEIKFDRFSQGGSTHAQRLTTEVPQLRVIGQLSPTEDCYLPFLDQPRNPPPSL